MADFQTENALTPFACSYSAQVPELLSRLNCSLAVTTYQAGKVIFISPKDENQLIQLPRTFAKPMGIAEDREKDKIAVACRDEIIVFANSPGLASFYPNSPGKYDAMYFPRTTYHTGSLDIHDLRFGSNGKLYAVNTLFSCIVEIDSDYNFRPVWRPAFIDQLASEDRCHLNGMAMKDRKPGYVSAFGTGNTMQSWREKVTTGGVLIDVDSNEIVANNLAMPHSPRMFGNDLYVLLSATGELVKVNPENGKYEVIIQLEGFVRGMSLYKDFLFVGISKLRKNSSTFAKLDLKHKADRAGIAVVHLPTGSLAGHLNWHSTVDEIYDVHVLPDKIRPNILNTSTEDYKNGVMIPETTFWAIRKEKENS